MKAAIPFPKFKKYLTGLVRAEDRLNYKAGQMIFYEGHYPHGIYVLTKGRVRLFTKKETGEDRLLKIVEPVQILGEEAFQAARPFDYSAKAETDVWISFFSRTAIREEGEKDHGD